EIRFNEFVEDSELINNAYEEFQDAQVTNNQGTDGFRQTKTNLQNRLKSLNDKLNVNLASDYRIDAKIRPKEFKNWLSTHQPFHWFAEFYKIIAVDGGFNVIIGNPPYLEMRQINYDVKGYMTRDGNAVHAMCIERSFSLLNKDGAMSMIVPLA